MGFHEFGHHAATTDMGSLGCLLVGCQDFDFLGLYSLCNIGAKSLSYRRGSEAGRGTGDSNTLQPVQRCSNQNARAGRSSAAMQGMSRACDLRKGLTASCRRQSCSSEDAVNCGSAEA